MIEEKIVIGAEGNWPLDGKLTLPDEDTFGKGPFPAAVLVHGSGSSDMDSAIANVKPFADIAEGLAARGVACMRYDKRTWKYGRKVIKALGSELSVKEETIEDAVMAAELLRNDARIDASRVFIAGLSMGAMLAPRINADGGNFAGLVMMAGSPRRLEDILKQQIDESVDSYKGIIGWIAKREIAKIKPKLENIYDLSDEEAKATKFMGGTTIYYLKEMGQKTAVDYLKMSDTPALIMQGDGDLQVSTEKDFKVFEQELANRPNTTFKLYKGLNHVFMPALYDKIIDAKKEFKQERHVEPSVIDDIADWIKAQ